MTSKLADGIVLAILLGIVWIGVTLCSNENLTRESEGRCSREAVDGLNGGRNPEEVLAQHAKCLRMDEEVER